MSALKAAGLYFPLLIEDILEDHIEPWILLMFSMYLFQVLPHYVPKGTIYFKSQLGIPMTKCIELANPSKRSVSYTCSLYGSPDFVMSAEHDPINIP